MGVITISGDQVIVRARRGDGASDDRLLPNVEVAKAADLLRLILLTRALLETPDQQHQREHLDLVALLRRLHDGRITQREAAAKWRGRARSCVRSSGKRRTPP